VDSADCEGSENIACGRSAVRREVCRPGGSRVLAALVCAGVFVALMVLAGLSMVQISPVVKASPDGGDTQLACDTCHSVELQSHSALGTGNKACHACHANPNMNALQLAGGTEVALANSVPLCAECHQARYSAWVSGTHGFPGFEAGKPVGASEPQTNCTTCHNPHQPRMVLTNITKPHPEPAPAPPAPPKDALMILGISLAVVGGALVVTLAGKGRS